jgi:hypothetical protein
MDPAGIIYDKQNPEIQGTTPETCRCLPRMQVAQKLQTIPDIPAARVAFYFSKSELIHV